MNDFKFSTSRRALPSWGERAEIKATVRFNDHCSNGHQDFAITADIYEGKKNVAGGCCHDEVREAFPELAPFIKWHLCSTDGPMHYIANTLFWAKRAVLGRCNFDGTLDEDARKTSARHAANTAIWPELEDRLNAFYEAHGEPEQTAASFLKELEADLNARLPGLLEEFMADMARVREVEA